MLFFHQSHILEAHDDLVVDPGLGLAVQAAVGPVVVPLDELLDVRRCRRRVGPLQSDDALAVEDYRGTLPAFDLVGGQGLLLVSVVQRRLYCLGHIDELLVACFVLAGLANVRP